jgi:hypothetical protein
MAFRGRMVYSALEQHWSTEMIQGLRTAIYPVTDIARGKAWYAQVLGREPYFDQPFYVGFSVGGFENPHFDPKSVQ